MSPGRIAAPETSDGGRQSLYVYSGGFLTQPRIRRILSLSGFDIRIGKPGAPGDNVGVWGRSPTAPRGEAMADWTGTQVVRIEDAFLRSLRPGRVAGEPPIGLFIDDMGVHFDSSSPSRIEAVLSHDPLDDSAILERARVGMARLQAVNLSKYNDFDPELEAPEPGYVLVVDQTRDDASILYGKATAATFREMLVFAQEEHPGARIVIKAHPETMAGARLGHYGDGHAHGQISLLDRPVSPWRLLEGAIAVYTVSSQLGFEAIMAGHRPRVFGQPFYSGWGLTVDENPVARRERKLTRAQLFAAAMIIAPTWYDPCRDRLCSFEEVVNQLEADVAAFRQDRKGHVAVSMRLWKRRHLQEAFGGEKPLRFQNDPGRAAALARAEGRGLMVWAGSETKTLTELAKGIPLLRVEDGFLRSRGLGAELVPPISLVADPAGIYYDPAHESRLDRLIAAGPPPGGAERAERLVARLIRDRLSKYNLGGAGADGLREGRRILVPGQVEDDASIRRGAGAEHTNLALLNRVRQENPDAVIIYKPHPDVEAGLRLGKLSRAEITALGLADHVAENADPVALIGAVDEVWTITSLLGFEALLRGKKVTCLGLPFYAGWGLTHDMMPRPPHRQAHPSMAELAHAALIAYPRYRDPVSGLPCPPEVAVERLARHEVPAPGRPNRLLAKVQGLFASQAWLWRR
jgi:capsular polysaccharide export protein